MADTVELVGSRIGIGGLGAIMGGLLALSALAGTSSWIAGAARVPFAAGVDHALPSWFGHLHGRYRTPDVSLIVQGLAASAIFLASVFISVSHQQTTIQEAYDILVNLTILIYFVPYLYLFPALVRLRPAGSPAVDERRVPGGNAGMYIVAAIGFLATAISLALVFIPPPGTRNAMNYEVNLIGQALVILGVGLAMYWYARGAGRKLLGEN